MSQEHHRAALTVLNRLCTEPDGLPRTTLLDAVMTKFPQREADDVARIVATTLGQLERDGYLIRIDGEARAAATYAFRSFLLRGYWHARELA
jgi:hypothetical protein